MRKFLTILFLIIVTTAYSQRYCSYNQIYEQSGYAITIEDTVKIIIEDNKTSKLIIISSDTTFEFLSVKRDINEYNNMLGLKILSYPINNVKIDLYYDSGILRQIAWKNVIYIINKEL